MVSRNLLSFMDEETLENRFAVTKRKSWDDEYILKRQFSALIPAFDPRPGRTNVNQTSDLEIPPPGSDNESHNTQIVAHNQPTLQLILKLASFNGLPEAEIPLNNPDWTIFRAVQELLQLSAMSKQDRMKKVWDPTYTIIYREASNKLDFDVSEEGVITPVASSGSLPHSRHNILSPESPHTISNASVTSIISPTPQQTTCSVDDVLQLLCQLNSLNMQMKKADDDLTSDNDHLNPELFLSKKITNKLHQQIQDPLVLSSNSLPSWCEELNQSYPFLFPFETRQLYFNCTAFGASRSIVWLQSQRDVTLERQRLPGLSPRRDDQHEFRVGRLKHERVKVPRNDNLLEWAMQVMKIHCSRKSVLEVEFLGEEGTGLGPTLEFYALVAAELQRSDLAMWLTDDEELESKMDGASMEIDLGEGSKPIGYYVRRPFGLFPAPLPQESEMCEKVSKYFWFLGVFIAKVLQDGRLVDLPLSQSFLQLLCHNKTMNSYKKSSTLNTKSSDDIMTSSIMSEESDRDAIDMCARNILNILPETYWYDGVLNADNLKEIDPIRAEFLNDLQELVYKKNLIESNEELTTQARVTEIQNLRLNLKNGSIAVEDLALTFTFSPSSKVYNYQSYDLIPNGSSIDVTIENLEEYCELTTNFCLQSGIAKQLEAFHQGFSQVFPLNKLAAFTPNEARMMICGEQHPEWTKEDLLNFTDPKLGYTKDR